MNLCRYAHLIFQERIQPGDLIIDATCGNGHDLYFLAQCLQGTGKLYGYDLQRQAIENTQKRIKELPLPWQQTITLHHQSHSPFLQDQAHLIVYNLGYLPGSSKEITTQTATTLSSIQHALEILLPHGAISILCYPGHAEGYKEWLALTEFLPSLGDLWSILQIHHHRPHSPILFLLEKRANS